MTTTPPRPIILFDGVCNLCARAVQFVLRRDPRGVFRFASLQSEAGQKLLQQHGLDPSLTDSLVLVEDGQALVYSEAVLGVAAQLGGGWPMLARLGRLASRPLRDWVYRQWARRRYALFGQAAQCWLPRAIDADRFLA